MFQVMFTDRPAIRSYREFCAYADRVTFKKFAHGLLKRGIYMSPAASLHSVTCLAHEDEDIETAAVAVGETLDELKKS